MPDDVLPKKKLIFPLEVLFEDEHLAVIHKPPGIQVSGNTFKTIANALKQNIASSSLDDSTSPQPVHRLDYATTGILLIGKTTSSIRALNKMFEEREIKKIYYAITIGKMNGNGEITAEIDSKNSYTNYRVQQSVPSKRFGWLNLVELQPYTGRRHQLRKHLLSIGNPILGDKEYCNKNQVLRGKGLYLHAFSLEFTHPFTNDSLVLRDRLPEKFEKIFSLIK